ncbi:hypothetical protein KJ815_13465, partial [bacterium]|nr:hypothetical protein [bacterium]
MTYLLFYPAHCRVHLQFVDSVVDWDAGHDESCHYNAGDAMAPTEFAHVRAALRDRHTAVCIYNSLIPSLIGMRDTMNRVTTMR